MTRAEGAARAKGLWLWGSAEGPGGRGSGAGAQGGGGRKVSSRWTGRLGRSHQSQARVCISPWTCVKERWEEERALCLWVSMWGWSLPLFPSSPEVLEIRAKCHPPVQPPRQLQQF